MKTIFIVGVLLMLYSCGYSVKYKCKNAPVPSVCEQNNSDECVIEGTCMN